MLDIVRGVSNKNELLNLHDNFSIELNEAKTKHEKYQEGIREIESYQAICDNIAKLYETLYGTDIIEAKKERNKT